MEPPRQLPSPYREVDHVEVAGNRVELESFAQDSNMQQMMTFMVDFLHNNIQAAVGSNLVTCSSFMMDSLGSYVVATEGSFVEVIEGIGGVAIVVVIGALSVNCVVR